MKFFSRTGLLVPLVVLVASAQTPERLSLDEALNMAVNNNPEGKAAQEEIAAASGRVLQAGRIPDPELSVTFNEVPTNFSIGNAGERDIGISQSIEFPGKRSSRVAAAEYGESVAVLSLARTRAILLSRVKRTYYQGLLAEEIVANLEFTIMLLSDFLRTVTERYQAGTSTYLEVIRAKVELTRLRNDIVEARHEHQTRLAELNILLGRPGNTPVALSDTLYYQPITMQPDSAVEFYARQSNYLKMIYHESRHAESLLDLARTSYLPDFSLGVALQQRPGSISPTGSSTFLGLQFGATVPLWFWQGPKGSVQEAEAQREISAIRVSATGMRARHNILLAFRSAMVAQEQLRVFDASLLRDAEDELRAGISAYQNNQIDALNLLDIYRTVKATKSEHVRALYNFLAAKAALEVAGEGVE